MFEKSTEFLDMIKSVSDRMGLTSLLNLGFRLNPHLYIFLNFLNVFYCNEYRRYWLDLFHVFVRQSLATERPFALVCRIQRRRSSGKSVKIPCHWKLFLKIFKQILEYREDLEYFYEDGYGYEINYEQACTPLKDVFENFRLENYFLTNIFIIFHSVFCFCFSDKRWNKVAPPKGFFYFTHSGTILKGDLKKLPPLYFRCNKSLKFVN